MFDRSAAALRLAKLWALEAHFGEERGANRVYLDEIVSDRMQLTKGLQVLRDELQLAPPPGRTDREAAGADLSQPSVLTTQAFTNCGDRIHQAEIEQYHQIVAARFATLSEIGIVKPEAFHPTGGGTDDGATLAHVTWAHAVDAPMRARIYDGNAQSFVLCAFDLKTHCGRLDDESGGVGYGTARESPWREPRAACGAIVGALKGFDPKNGVHARIHRDLGDENFELLAGRGVRTPEGVDITALVAAAIVGIRGMRNTARALLTEMDERGVAHLTATITVNRPSMPATLIYLSRATVFEGEIRMQGFGTDAKAYAGDLVQRPREKRVRLSYEGRTGAGFTVERA